MAIPLAVRPDDRAGPRPGGSSAPALIPLTRWGQVLAANEKQLHRNNLSAAHPAAHPKAVLIAALRPRNLPAGPGRFQGSGVNALLQSAKPFDPADRFQTGQLLHAGLRTRAERATAHHGGGFSLGDLGHLARTVLLPEVAAVHALAHPVRLLHHPEQVAQAAAEEEVPALHTLRLTGLGPRLSQVGVPQLPEGTAVGRPRASSLFGLDLGGAAGAPVRLVGQAIEAAVGAPAGAAMLAAHPVREAKAYGRQYAETYGPLVHGDFGEFAHQVNERPLGPLLDAWTALSLGAGAGAKAGLLARPATERAVSLPGTEGHVQPFASPNTLTRVAQHRLDRFSETHPDLPVVGAEARVAHNLGHEAQRNLERAQQPALPFQAVERKLGPRLKVAYDVLHAYGHQQPTRALHLLDEEIKTRATRLADKSTPFIERAHQMVALRQLQEARRSSNGSRRTPRPGP
jgi:hypothetical protein